MIEIVSPEDGAAVREFAALPRRLYGGQAPRVSRSLADAIALFRHQTPFSDGRTFLVLIARDGRRTVARAVAVLDTRYNSKWKEALGHIIMFEALPGARKASRQLFNTAFQWLREQGAETVRTGYGPFEPGYLIDDYATYLPRMMRHTLPHYHSLLKDAGFETEKGAGEYIIAASDDVATRYRGYLRSVEQSGYDIVGLAELPAGQRVTDFTSAWNEAYETHWGLAPTTEQEFALLVGKAGERSTIELSVIAYREGRPVGVALAREAERFPWSWSWWLAGQNAVAQLGCLSVGAAPTERGRGLALGLASHVYLHLLSRGQTRLGYGLVADDNWPSRRVAEKLGAFVCANYLTYRRSL